MGHMDTQLQSLDSIATRLRDQNNAHHTAHTNSLASLASTVQSSYDSIGEHLATSFTRVQELNSDMNAQTAALQETLPALSEDADVRKPLRALREEVESQDIMEYAPTGETPQRSSYSYPSTLPRTEGREQLIARLRGSGLADSTTPEGTPEPARSPTKTMVFNDSIPLEEELSLVPSAKLSPPLMNNGLRELDVNTIGQDNTNTGLPVTVGETMPPPPLKRQNTNGLDKSAGADTKLPMKMRKARMTVAGLGSGIAAQDRENAPITNFSASVGAGGRRLRSHASG